MSKEIQSISFDDGIKEVMIDNDPDRVIRWNPTDADFVVRFYDMQKFFEDKNKEFAQMKDKIKDKDKLDDDGNVSDEYTTVAKDIRKLGKQVNDELDKTFNANVSEVAFQGTNPLSPTESGNFIFINFIQAIMPVVESSFEASFSKVNKETDKTE